MDIIGFFLYLSLCGSSSAGSLSSDSSDDTLPARLEPGDYSSSDDSIASDSSGGSMPSLLYPGKYTDSSMSSGDTAPLTEFSSDGDSGESLSSDDIMYDLP